jgi:uncharacterized membrane protein
LRNLLRTLLKRATAAACFTAGGVLLSTYGVMAARAVADPAHGMPLLTLAGAFAGVAAIGGGIDLLAARARKVRQEGIAQSVWASPDDLRRFNVLGD